LNALIDGLHATRRKLWDKAFATAALRDYQPLILNRLAQLIDQLDTHTHDGRIVDLNEWLGYFVWDGPSLCFLG
jgi:cytochrome P450